MRSSVITNGDWLGKNREIETKAFLIEYRLIHGGEESPLNSTYLGRCEQNLLIIIIPESVNRDILRLCSLLLIPACKFFFTWHCMFPEVAMNDSRSYTYSRTEILRILAINDDDDDR